MKNSIKTIAIVLCLCLMVTALVACAKTYKVTYYDSDKELSYENVKTGKMATTPKAPTKDGYTFEGWYTDKELTSKYDFTKTVTADTKLYAKWTPVTPSA